MQMNRRDCLTMLAAAAIAHGSSSTGVEAADAPSGMPLGFSLYGMKSLTLAEALAECAKIGYDGVELALMPDWPADPKQLSAEARRELAQRLAGSGLALLGLMENISEPAEEAQHLANLERLKAAAELGHALSPKTPTVIETILGGKPTQWTQNRERLVERLRDWEKVAAASETVVTVKPHVANALHTPADALWLMQQVGSRWLKLAYDYSHFALQGLPLAETLTALIPKTEFVHVKDARGTAEKFEFLLPGESDVDYVAYFRALQAAGYQGPVVVEVSGQISGRAGYDPRAAARQSYASLAPAMDKAGVRRRK